jgi:type VII secretion integral membrane protein EccD
VLSTSDLELRRVSVHAGTAVVDLVLPAAVPVATLIPSIVDILDDCGADRSGDHAATAYRLSRPGGSALAASTTLAQNDIRDGAVLILSQPRTELPAPRYDDVADAVAATLDSDARPWTKRATRLSGAMATSFFAGIGGLMLVRNALSTNVTRHVGGTAVVAAITGFSGLIALLLAVMAHKVYRDPIAGLTLSLVATAFTAIAGFMAVPGTSGAPNVLLAAMAAAVTSVLSIRLTDSGIIALTAVSCFATVIAVAAFAGVVTAAPLRTIGSIFVLVSLGLLGIAGRISIVLAGLSPQLSDGACLTAKAVRADAWLTSLLAAFSSSAAVGAIMTAVAGRGTDAPRSGCIAFAAVTGALLLLRARSAEGRTTLVFVICGIATIGITFAVCAAGMPEKGPWIAAVTAMLAAVAVYLGFLAPVLSPSPSLRRGVELSEYLVLVAMAPLSCWICGFYGAVRGLNLT